MICSTKFSNWIENSKNSHWNNHVVYQQPNAIQSSGMYPTPCVATVDPSVIGGIIVVLLLFEQLNKYAFIVWMKSLDNLSVAPQS